MSAIELGPAGQDGTPFNADETRDIWDAIDRATDQGETTILALGGQPAAAISPPPGTVTYIAQQRILRDGFTGRWNDMPASGSPADAQARITRNRAELPASTRAEYQIVLRTDTVIRTGIEG